MINIKYLIVTFLIYTNSFGQKDLLIEYDYTNNINYTCTSQLFVSEKEAVFQINDKRESGFFDNGEVMGFVYNDKLSTFFYSTKEISYTRIPLYSSEIVYSQSTNNLKFELTGKAKVINNYNCNEAKLKLNNRIYTIWFTPDVNVNFGPYKINGLPGLIVELKEETNNINISLKSIKKLEDTKVFTTYKNLFATKKVLTFSEYEKNIVKIITAKKAKDIAYFKENEATMEYKEDQSFFTQDIIDIPSNLVEELKKIN